jgi:hypothetical protein
MHRKTLTAILSLVVLIGICPPALAAADKADAGLLEELRQLARQSREKQAADRWLQRALDDLVARYDRPWQRAILFEDFGDGDYTSNPSWELLGGHFEVIRGQGLVARDYAQQAPAPTSSAPSSDQQPDLAGALVGALMNRAFGPAPASKQAESGSEAGTAAYAGPDRLRLKADVSNAFAITATLRASSQPASRFEIALLQSQAARYGYRLRIDLGGQGLIELERIRNGRSAIVESRPLATQLGDGRLHDLAWRQAPDGRVSVLIDEQPVFSVVDRAFRDGYPWLVLSHDGGDLTLRSLRIEGT